MFCGKPFEHTREVNVAKINNHQIRPWCNRNRTTNFHIALNIIKFPQIRTDQTNVHTKFTRRISRIRLFDRHNVWDIAAILTLLLFLCCCLISKNLHMSDFNEGSIRTTPYINYIRVPSITVNYCRAYSFCAHCLRGPPLLCCLMLFRWNLGCFICGAVMDENKYVLMYSAINSIIILRGIFVRCVIIYCTNC